jgi:hypothetical protein
MWVGWISVGWGALVLSSCIGILFLKMQDFAILAMVNPMIFANQITKYKKLKMN